MPVAGNSWVESGIESGIERVPESSVETVESVDTRDDAHGHGSAHSLLSGLDLLESERVETGGSCIASRLLMVWWKALRPVVGGLKPKTGVVLRFGRNARDGSDVVLRRCGVVPFDCWDV
jgi:hypothetical protein